MGSLPASLARFGALHDLEFDVLEHRLALRQGGHFVLHRLQILRRTLTGVQPSLVTGRPLPHLFDVRLSLGQLAREVLLDRSSRDQLGGGRTGLTGQGLQRGVFGQGSTLVRELGQP